MKVLLVLNKPNREIPIMEAIRREICLINKNAMVEIKEMCTPEFPRFVFKFKPNVILTFPLTCEGFARWYYIFKFFLGAKIISMRAEGVMDFNSEYELERFVGYDSYGGNLVDYELSWGEKFARVVGEELVKQGRLSSLDRFRTVGHPRLESYFEQKMNLPSPIFRVLDRISNYKKEKIVLFITGFVLANYSKQNILDAKDMGGEDRMDKALEGVEIIKNFRSEWIRQIINVAVENPDALIIVKKHPLENRGDYNHLLEGIKNILYIFEDIQMSEIIHHVGVYFHYGSTSLIDAYLSGTPSIYVSSEKNGEWYSDLGWPSTRRIDINEISLTVKDFLAGHISFEMTDEIKHVMKEMFNIREGITYNPSREIAKIILDPTPPQKIKITDQYFLKALAITILTTSRNLASSMLLQVAPTIHRRAKNWLKKQGSR